MGGKVIEKQGWIICFNTLPNNKVENMSGLVTFTDNILNFGKMTQFSNEKVENIVWNEKKNAG